MLSVSGCLFLQRAGPGGVAGLHAVRNVAAGSRSAAEAASPRMACARARSKKDGPVTLSPALVSPPGLVTQLQAAEIEHNKHKFLPILLGKERSRNQGPRGIVSQKRDNADDSSYGVVATQTGEVDDVENILQLEYEQN